MQEVLSNRQCYIVACSYPVFPSRGKAPRDEGQVYNVRVRRRACVQWRVGLICGTVDWMLVPPLVGLRRSGNGLYLIGYHVLQQIPYWLCCRLACKLQGADCPASYEAAVAERLDCSPPTRANRVQSLAGSLPHFHMRESCRTMPLVCGFSRRSHVYPLPLIQALLHTHLASPLFYSQDLAVKSCPNLFPHFTPATYRVWSGAGIGGRGKREIPEKARRTFPLAKVRVTRPEIESGHPWWEASVLIAQPPRPQNYGRIYLTSVSHQAAARRATCRLPTQHSVYGDDTIAVNHIGVRLIRRFGRLFNIEVLRGADEGEVRGVCSNAGLQEREIPEKTRRPAASSGAIPTCGDPGATSSGIEPGLPGCLLASHLGDLGSIPGTWESCRTMPLVRGFSRGSPVSQALSFRRCSVLASITLIGSEDLDVKSLPNLFWTHNHPSHPSVARPSGGHVINPSTDRRMAMRIRTLKKKMQVSSHRLSGWLAAIFVLIRMQLSSSRPSALFHLSNSCFIKKKEELGMPGEAGLARDRRKNLQFEEIHLFPFSPVLSYCSVHLKDASRVGDKIDLHLRLEGNMTAIHNPHKEGSEYGAAPECKGVGNGSPPRKPADQRHRPARFQLAKIRIWSIAGMKGRGKREMSTGGIIRRDYRKVMLCFSHSPANKRPTSLARWGSGGAVGRALAFHQGDPDSTPGVFTPGFLHVGIVLDDAACRRVFSGHSRSPLPLDSSAARSYGSHFTSCPGPSWKARYSESVASHCVSTFDKLDSFTVTSNFCRGRGGVVVRLLASHLRETGFDFRWGRSRIFHNCCWREDFLRGLAFTHTAAPYSPHFTLIGSQDLAVKSRPNLFTHSNVSEALLKFCIRAIYLPNSPLKVPLLASALREHYTPVQSPARSGDGALEERASVTLIAPALLGLEKGGKRCRQCNVRGAYLSLSGGTLSLLDVCRQYPHPPPPLGAQGPSTVIDGRGRLVEGRVWFRCCYPDLVCWMLVRLLASHLGEPGSIPGWVAPGLSYVGIVTDDAAGRRVFSGISRFPPALAFRRCSALNLASPPSALRTSLFETRVSSTERMEKFGRHLTSRSGEPMSVRIWSSTGMQGPGGREVGKNPLQYVSNTPAVKPIQSGVETTEQLFSRTVTTAAPPPPPRFIQLLQVYDNVSILLVAEEYTTCIEVDHKQDFNKSAQLTTNSLQMCIYCWCVSSRQCDSSFTLIALQTKAGDRKEWLYLKRRPFKRSNAVDITARVYWVPRRSLVSGRNTFSISRLHPGYRFLLRTALSKHRLTLQHFTTYHCCEPLTPTREGIYDRRHASRQRGIGQPRPAIGATTTSTIVLPSRYKPCNHIRTEDNRNHRKPSRQKNSNLHTIKKCYRKRSVWKRSLLVGGATAAERLARSPPTKANPVQSRIGSPDFRKWESCR
ncbi:hypothetical protein PR048_033618 [Dryococelus australis]|uniref:Uncharacterized protein n=1 Tax=Dryococelus australis TaxID=614101 RepID=A0ABQ9G0T0_9NEOP|nr:hypothetical protein PR048_033618 [Dryococelus australis]